MTNQLVIFRGVFLPLDPKSSRLRSTVGNASGYRCASDCRSRGPKLDPGQFNIFVEIDHEIILTVIPLPSAESFKKGCCQLQAKVCAQSTGKSLVQACPGS